MAIAASEPLRNPGLWQTALGECLIKPRCGEKNPHVGLTIRGNGTAKRPWRARFAASHSGVVGAAGWPRASHARPMNLMLLSQSFSSSQVTSRTRTPGWSIRSNGSAGVGTAPSPEGVSAVGTPRQPSTLRSSGRPPSGDALYEVTQARGVSLFLGDGGVGKFLRSVSPAPASLETPSSYPSCSCESPRLLLRSASLSLKFMVVPFDQLCGPYRFGASPWNCAAGPGATNNDWQSANQGNRLQKTGCRSGRAPGLLRLR